MEKKTMKVKELLKTIKENQKQYPDFLNWTVALEQHFDYKNCSNCNKPKDSIFDFNTLFIKSHCKGCYSCWSKEKVFGIQIHY